MSFCGIPSQWSDVFPDGLLPVVLRLIVESWSNCAQPSPNEREVPITMRFLAVLRQNQEVRFLPFLIDREVWVDPISGSENARIDLRVIHGYRRRVYLAFECKRLHVAYPSGWKSESGAYVTDGMMRFIQQKYAEGMTRGGMIAYVMDGDTEGAITAVASSIASNRDDLQMAGTAQMGPSSVLPERNEIRESPHQLANLVFTIHHVFLAVG